MKHLPKYIVIGALMLLCIGYLFSRCTLFTGSDKENPKKEETPKIVLKASDEVKKILKDMTLEEKIYQMFYVTPEQITGVDEVVRAGETTKIAIEEKNVGGIIYSEKNLQTPEQTKELLKTTQGYAKIPMFLGTMEEGGEVFAISKNIEMNLGELPPASQISSSDEAYEIGTKIGEELVSLGFNMNFAPVADILGEGMTNAVGGRSFGYDKDDVSRKIEWMIKGMRKGGIMTTLKHFPGQGFTEGDTALGYPVTERTPDEIKKVELAPFKAGIESGSEFVMIGHVSVPEIDADKPATFSYKIVTELLRNEMGFEGIIITSPMNEGAVLNSHTSADAAIEAVLAGADMILKPNNLEIAYEALYDAVRSGKISEDRINESVTRILNYKEKQGLL